MTMIKNNISKYNLDKDIQLLKELKIRYSHRLKSKKGNGYFDFIGYKELVNKLLIKVDINDNIQLSDIKDENHLQYLLDNNIIKLNVQFLELFTNSLVICDEIHNVYNSLNINNWGMCLRIIFKYHDKQKSLRVLFLSATPINNKPIEIISLLNLLNSEIYINKNDIFDKLNKITEKGYILIKKYIYGKISYLKDMDLTAYPAKEIKGQIINNIDYLIFDGLTPIELPSDEEVLEECNKLPFEKHVDCGLYNDGQIDGFELGAKWMKEQILKNK